MRIEVVRIGRVVGRGGDVWGDVAFSPIVANISSIASASFAAGLWSFFTVDMAVPPDTSLRVVFVPNELRSMRLAISRRIDRALNSSAS